MQARPTIMLSNAVHKLLGLSLSQYGNAGELSYKDESLYFQRMEAKLWRYIDALEKKGGKKVVPLKKIAADLNVSEFFVANILEEAGLLDDGDEGD